MTGIQASRCIAASSERKYSNDRQHILFRSVAEWKSDVEFGSNKFHRSIVKRRGEKWSERRRKILTIAAYVAHGARTQFWPDPDRF